MRSPILRRTLGTVCIVGIAILVTECGGGQVASPTSPTTAASSTTPSQSTLAQANVGGIMAPVASGVSGAFAAFGAAIVKVHSSTSVPISAQMPCPSGGSVGVAGSLSGALSDSGDGEVDLNEEVTFSDCLSNGVLLQGNPNITLSGQFTYANFAPVNPLVVRIGNGVTFTYNSVQGSLQYDCAANLDMNGGGTFGGSITIQYPIGVTSTTVSCAGL